MIRRRHLLLRGLVIRLWILFYFYFLFLIPITIFLFLFFLLFRPISWQSRSLRGCRLPIGFISGLKKSFCQIVINQKLLIHLILNEKQFVQILFFLSIIKWEIPAFPRNYGLDNWNYFMDVLILFWHSRSE